MVVVDSFVFCFCFCFFFRRIRRKTQDAQPILQDKEDNVNVHVEDNVNVGVDIVPKIITKKRDMVVGHQRKR